MDIDLQLLLPWRSAPVDYKLFATHLPMFNQSFGDLEPHVAFRKFELAGSNSAVTIDVCTLSPPQLVRFLTYFHSLLEHHQS